ncbi:Potassium voltage-gated channel protein eag [Hondaea fermentalgiana]|uniref:Potassium voltage-gated channel protein eag n=1 Tax=Hondaea fermentalgiana TaxID=2315210 RepID=A0A2R5GTQ4_9STRA|nr:Potassium voltage-gated channel protein eag [Hondaea fermentalgiana]|eukprot:GBG34246.1 Potassium voltage-gated channel protein eag [Hondaea fermentalgiana]
MACYLTFDVANLGTLHMTWSEEPIEGALAMMTPENPVPKFKFRQNGGRSEIIRRIREDKRTLFRGWCDFVKTGRDLHGTFEILDTEHEAAQIHVTFNTFGDLLPVLAGEEYHVYDHSAVAVTHRENKAFNSVKTMNPAQRMLLQAPAAETPADDAKDAVEPRVRKNSTGALSSVELVGQENETKQRFYGSPSMHKGAFYHMESEKRRGDMSGIFKSFTSSRASERSASDALEESPSRRRHSSVRPSAPARNIEASKMECLNDLGLWDSFYRADSQGKTHIGNPAVFQLLAGDRHAQYRTTYDRALGKNIESLPPKEEGVRRSAANTSTAKVAPEEALARTHQNNKSRNDEKRGSNTHSWLDGLRFVGHLCMQVLFVEVILPHYRFQRIWELWIVVCVLWNAVLLPYHLAFAPNPNDQSETVSTIDGVIDICFIIDLFLNFATAYVDDWGTLITDRREIGRSYLSHWFWVDLPATLPFELFVPPSEATAINMVKCIRLIRITKIFKFLERFRFANSARIMRLFASLMLVCHWIGCLWFFIGVNTSTPCESWADYFDPTLHDVRINGTWVFLDGPYPEGQTAYCSWLSLHRLGTDEAPVTSKYLKSVYWSVTTITSVGYGDVVPITDAETLFTIANMLLGAAIYAMIFSNFVSYIARMDQSSTKYSEKMEDIREQMRYLRLPTQIRTRVEQYFEYVWLCHKGLLDRSNYFYDELPLPLHLECAEFLHLKTLEANPLFKTCSRSFLRGMALRLKPQLVVPGEYVVNKGDAATAIFFVARGELEVLTDFQGHQLGCLEAGDYFGDIGVLTRTKRTASIRALSFCDLHYLAADDLRELLLVYEKDADMVSRNALEFVRIFADTQKDNMASDHDRAILERVKTGLQDPGIAASPSAPALRAIFPEDDPEKDEGIASASRPKRTQIVNPVGGRKSDA